MTILHIRIIRSRWFIQCDRTVDTMKEITPWVGEKEGVEQQENHSTTERNNTKLLYWRYFCWCVFWSKSRWCIKSRKDCIIWSASSIHRNQQNENDHFVWLLLSPFRLYFHDLRSADTISRSFLSKTPFCTILGVYGMYEYIVCICSIASVYAKIAELNSVERICIIIEYTRKMEWYCTKNIPNVICIVFIQVQLLSYADRIDTCH